MRSAVLQLPVTRKPSERRQVMRAAIRQLDRADLYLSAVDYMSLEDGEANRAIRRLRADLNSLRSYLVEARGALEG